jgi:hypothetical protein
MSFNRNCQFFVAMPFAILLSLSSQAGSSPEPSAALLQKVAKMDACAMALGQNNEGVSKALQLRAEMIMFPYYTPDLDAMADEQYNQIPWVKKYNAYYIEQQNLFHQTGAPEFAKEAAQQEYQAACLKLATEELKKKAP